jgi:hypothetical protein
MPDAFEDTVDPKGVDVFVVPCHFPRLLPCLRSPLVAMSRLGFDLLSVSLLLPPPRTQIKDVACSHCVMPGDLSGVFPLARFPFLTPMETLPSS